ncbi:MAG: hypothetical protein Q9196_005876 [Gyalolechia fulgens]
MTSSKNTVIAFDLYGTLLSTESVAKELAKHFDQYIPFSTITERSLFHALSEYDLSLPSEEALHSLMSAYDSLSAFPDVAPELELIARNRSVTPVVFSNGTQKMVTNSVYHSPDLSAWSKVFKDIITVDGVKKFKPHPDVYYHLADMVGKSRDQMGEMWLVSGNPFDIVGAKAAGMRTCWVDREGVGWVDGLIEGPNGRPDLVMRGLGELVQDEKGDVHVGKPWEKILDQEKA